MQEGGWGEEGEEEGSPRPPVLTLVCSVRSFVGSFTLVLKDHRAPPGRQALCQGRCPSRSPLDAGGTGNGVVHDSKVGHGGVTNATPGQ